MGSWFSNFHIRKKDTITTQRVCDSIKDALAQKTYIPAACAQDADIAVAIVDNPNSRWITVCSAIFAHDDADSCKSVGQPLSSDLNTDVMGIACFDSDYLYLNLVNADDATDAWVGIGEGKEIGIARRNNLTAWKKKVTDYAGFSAAAKGIYVCADEFLAAVEDCLGLDAQQASLSAEYLLETSCRQDVLYLYFRQEEGAHHRGPELRICNLRYAQPCFDGRSNEVSFINVGEEFCGLTVYFLGPYVEENEITFSDVKMERFQRPSIDLELKKIRLPNGQWAFCCHDPEILMPPGVPKRMKQEKRYQLELDRMRTISFVPHGNPRKMLDVSVVIVPDGNPHNQVKWNVWQQYGSKEAFIKHHNKLWKRIRAFEEDPNQLLPLLREEDFDL